MLSSAISKFRQLHLKAKLALLAAVVVVFASGMVIVSEQPGFCNTCHIMNRYYDSWKVSAHSEVNCLECHLQPGLMGHVKGKINGLAQAVDCMVGRVGTKPKATMLDVSCLRSECHDSTKLVGTEADFGGVKFPHAKHIGREVGGIQVRCATCHSHFEGDEHFGVNRDVCFTCHFLKDVKTGKTLVQTKCLDCHDPPDKLIKRGMVTVNHKEFAFYRASCEASCHRAQVVKESLVSPNVCLNCHDHTMPQETDVERLHSVHTESEKTECFACHGKVEHGPSEDAPLALMMDCKGCHSDTHNVQFGIYTANGYEAHEQNDRVLSPMFLTHVECTGCHIKKDAVRRGSIASIGTVARAVPEACDNCHEPGTGKRYIPFWQGQIKRLHEQVSAQVAELEERLPAISDESRAQTIKEKIAQARLFLQSVENDGSWGVHNLKYSEAILLKAAAIIGESE